MRSALTGGENGEGLAEDSIELILKAINDMQEKIIGQVDDKLKNYVTLPEFRDLESDHRSTARKV